MDFTAIRDEIRATVKVSDWIGTVKRVDCPETDCDGKGNKADCQPYDDGWYCFVCKTRGDLFRWVMLTNNCSFMGALRLLADYAGIALDPNPERSSLLETFLFRAIQYAKENPKCLDYMTGVRHLDKETLENHSIGYCDLDGDVLEATGFSNETLINLGLVYPGQGGLINYMGGRYIFPIRNANGMLVSIKGRANPQDIKDLDPRRKSMPLKADGPWGRHSHMDCLYLEENLRHYNDYTFICEGEPDTLTLRSWGINSLGLMTNTGIHKHYHKLKHLDRVYFALDNDNNTQKHIITELYNLQVKIPDTTIYNVTLPKSEDDKKVDVNDYKVLGYDKKDFHNLATNSPEAAELIIREWAPLFGKDKIYSAKLYHLIGALKSRRERLLNLLSDLVGVPVDMLAFAVDTIT